MDDLKTEPVAVSSTVSPVLYTRLGKEVNTNGTNAILNRQNLARNLRADGNTSAAEHAEREATIMTEIAAQKGITL